MTPSEAIERIREELETAQRDHNPNSVDSPWWVLLHHAPTYLAALLDVADAADKIKLKTHCDHWADCYIDGDEELAAALAKLVSSVKGEG